MEKILGLILVDRITGFRGTATGICYYLHGKTQILVEAQMRSDDKPATAWIDEDRLDKVNEEAKAVDTGPTGMATP